jgi:DNA-directed RNA polymerase subunit F
MKELLYMKIRSQCPEVADEMHSILSDRNRIMQKKELESINEKWNEFLNNGFDEEYDSQY